MATRRKSKTKPQSAPEPSPALRLDDAELAMLQRNSALADTIRQIAEAATASRQRTLDVWEAQLVQRVQERLGVDLREHKVTDAGEIVPREG
jgi:hypothetical protein